MQSTHPSSSYPAPADSGPCESGRRREVAAEISRLSDIHRYLHPTPARELHNIGRRRVTRTIDAVLEFNRRWLPPLHWITVRFLALLLYGYAYAVASTVRFTTLGSYRWPNIPAGSVLAVWHGNAPSLLAAFAALRPKVPLTLMVASDPRGDCIAVFCRWLGLKIVRGDAEHGGWQALNEIAQELCDGSAALISPDGSGFPLVARIGAAALASGAGAPLIPVGADCAPAVFERHKWDHARNPLPFGRIAIACGAPLTFPPLEDAASMSRARQQLQDALEFAAEQARCALRA